MPMAGFGTWPLDNAQVESAVFSAIKGGYRLIDTAEGYGNEIGVGRGIRSSGVNRDDIFITSKFGRQWHGFDLVAQTFDESATRLGVDYIDLFLIHWPAPEQDRYVEAFNGLIRLFEQGKVRAIGTSNFKATHLDRLFAETGQLPDVNQIQCSPELSRSEIRRYHSAHSIVTNSWAPLGGEGGVLLSNPVVKAIAASKGRTSAQVLLRWQIEQGLVPIAKSSSPERAVQNLDIFSFSLHPAEMEALDSLDRGEGDAIDSDEPGH